MDYYQGVVTEYLRANRATFVNTEYCIQLKTGQNPDTSGPHWYCDAVALDFSESTIFLVEISYAARLEGLCDRLAAWHNHWPDVCEALKRDSSFGEDVKFKKVRPWLFVPTETNSHIKLLLSKLTQIATPEQRLFPRITPLEFAQPWKYCSWNRQGEKPKPDVIPEAMRI